MKFHKGDIVAYKSETGVGELTFSHEVSGGYWIIDSSGNTHGVCYDAIKLIRRADEPAWPADVPRCELPLPEGMTRIVAKGYGWKGDALDLWIFYWDGKRWTQTGSSVGAKELFYAEAVNDADYQPPASEPASPPQGKITKTDEMHKLRHIDLPGVWVQFENGNARLVYRDNTVVPGLKEFPALAELLNAATKEVTPC